MSRKILKEPPELQEYRKWVGMNWHLHQGDTDDLFRTVELRDELHDLLQNMSRAESEKVKQAVRQVDQIWQEFCLSHKEPEFIVPWRREGVPKKHWWWWIDKLDQLSKEDLKTL